MNSDRPDRDLDTSVARWMGGVAPQTVPTSVLEAAFARTMVARQARVYPWHRAFDRSHQRGLPLLALAATGVLLVAALGFGVLGGGAGPSPTSGPSPSPTSGPSQTTAPSPKPKSTPSHSPGPSVAPGYGILSPGFQTPRPLVPASPLPDPAGSPLPSELIGRLYNPNPQQPGDVQGSQLLVLTLRAADDPHCFAMYQGRSTCFTILWTPNYPKHIQDAAVRGPARIVDGQLALGFALIPNGKECEGTTSTYAIEDAGDTLRGVDVPACSGFQGWTPH